MIISLLKHLYYKYKKRETEDNEYFSAARSFSSYLYS